MTRQAAYRLQQLAEGKCGRGCQRPRWGNRTLCEPCAKKLRVDRRIRYQDAREDQRQQEEAA